MQNSVDSVLTKQLTRIEMVRRGENTFQTTGRERITTGSLGERPQSPVQDGRISSLNN